jgi:PAS domain S-box-containing protein
VKLLASWRFDSGLSSERMLFRKAKPYLIALLTVAAATALRLALIPLLGTHSLPFLTYFAAVLLSAWFGGLPGGICAGFLSVLAVHFAFVAPQPGTFLSPAAAAAAMAVFGLDIGLILYINYAYRRATAEQKEHEWQIRQQLQAMELLNDVGQTCLRAGISFEDSLGEVVEAAIALTGAAKGTLQLFDDSCHGLKLVAQRGFEEPFLRYFDVVTTQGSVCELAMKSRRRASITDLANSAELASTASLQVLLDAGVQAVQSTPLISSAGNLLGMISTHYAAPAEPTQQQLALVDLLARQTADFLERKQAERALRASEVQLRQILNAVPTGITRCSRDLRYLAANPAYAAISKVPLDQIVGRTILEVLGAEGWDAIRPYVERVLAGEDVEYETEVPSGTAGLRFLHVIYTPEKDEQGQVSGWIASVTDMTAFREAKKNLARLERLAAAGQLAATLAHEINNPLNAVMNCLYILQTGARDEESKKSLVDAASAELTRMGRIVNQSLSYYRTGTAPQKVDLAALIQDSLQIFANRLEHSGIRARRKVYPAPAVMGFPNEFRQVIDNLLLNAMEAMPRGGVLSITVRPSILWPSGESGVRVTIADTGCGMHPAILDKIFDPFFTTKAEKGTGLGLWVVRGILMKHGASIRVRTSSNPERTGTVISFHCPAPPVANKKAVPVPEAALSGSMIEL